MLVLGPVLCATWESSPSSVHRSSPDGIGGDQVRLPELSVSKGGCVLKSARHRIARRLQMMKRVLCAL